jgi:hypothetical protein
MEHFFESDLGQKLADGMDRSWGKADIKIP